MKIGEMEKNSKILGDSIEKMREFDGKIILEILAEENAIIEAAKKRSKELQAKVLELEKLHENPLMEHRKNLSEQISQAQSVKDETDYMLKKEGITFLSFVKDWKQKLEVTDSNCDKSLSITVNAVTKPKIIFSSFTKNAQQEASKFGCIEEVKELERRKKHEEEEKKT